MPKAIPKKKRIKKKKFYKYENLALELAEFFQLPPNLIWYTVKFQVDTNPIIQCESEIRIDDKSVIEGEGPEAKIKRIRKKFKIIKVEEKESKIKEKKESCFV